MIVYIALTSTIVKIVNTINPKIETPNDEDKFIPPDNSRKPYINANAKFDIFLEDESMLDKQPVIVEKNTTYPQIDNIEYEELVIDDVNVLNVNFDDLCLISIDSIVSLHINLCDIAIMIEVEIVTIYNIIPIFLFEYIDRPTVLIINPELGLLQNVNIRDASFSLILPFSSNEIVTRAPMGNPHKNPRITAHEADFDIFKNFSIGCPIMSLIISPKPLFTISSDITIKGKREGITVFTQSNKPDLIYSIAISAFFINNMRVNKNKDINIISFVVYFEVYLYRFDKSINYYPPAYY